MFSYSAKLILNCVLYAFCNYYINKTKLTVRISQFPIGMMCISYYCRRFCTNLEIINADDELDDLLWPELNYVYCSHNFFLQMALPAAWKMSGNITNKSVNNCLAMKTYPVIIIENLAKV